MRPHRPIFVAGMKKQNRADGIPIAIETEKEEPALWGSPVWAMRPHRPVFVAADKKIKR